MADRQTFTAQNAVIKYRNFSGRPTKFNPQGGDRAFTIILDDLKVAQDMSNDGWNVKFPKPEDDDQDIVIDIKVKYNEKGPRPRIVCVTSTSRFDIDEDTVDLLDGMDIASCDLICNAHFYELTDRSGISAYLKKLVIVIEEDELDKKWGLNTQFEKESVEVVES